jgi:hypothetical protein
LKAVRLAQLFECLKLKKIKTSKNKNTNSNLSLFTLVYIASEEHERAVVSKGPCLLLCSKQSDTNSSQVLLRQTPVSSMDADVCV